MIGATIMLTLPRAALQAHGACDPGLALFDAVADLAGTPDAITVEWTPLAALWLAVGAPDFARWLRGHGLTPGANLSGADLSRADLSRAYLSRADLSRANLSGANLSGADLSRADLSRANLSGADLSGAYLSGAYLSRADLRGAYLSRANLSGADLSGAYRFSYQTEPLGGTMRDGALRRAEAT
jgi:hypothetical protein